MIFRAPSVLRLVCALAAVPLSLATANSQPKAPTPAVTVETVSDAPFVRVERYTAEVSSPEKVDIVARVEGVLGPRQVADGASVSKGDVLFKLDDAPYRAALAVAKASLASAQAAEVLAKATLDRSKVLERRNTVAQATVDANQAAYDEAVAATDEAKANVTIAELNVEYATIAAPLTGRIGTQLFSEGALVSSTSGTLVTVFATDPMRLRFSVPQRQVLRARAVTEETGVPPTLNVILSDGSTYGAEAKILFAEPRAVTTTDSVSIVAEVPNPDGYLLDGQIVTISVSRKEAAEAITIPQTAVLRDTQGTYALVVGADDKVAEARLALGDRSGQRVVVTSGLKVGDKVVVVGQGKVRPGMAVTTTEAAQPSTTSGAGATALGGASGSPSATVSASSPNVSAASPEGSSPTAGVGGTPSTVVANAPSGSDDAAQATRSSNPAAANGNGSTAGASAEGASP